MKKNDQQIFIEKLKKRLGENVTDQQLALFLHSLSHKEMFQLIMDMALEETRNEMPDFPLADDSDYRDEDDDEERNDDDTSGDEAFTLTGSGRLECMPAKEIKKYTIRIKLRGISPSIWRKIEVPSSVKLTSLAEIILAAMGWSDYHLHQFYAGGGRSTVYSTVKTDDGDFDTAWGPKPLWGGDYSIGHLLKAAKDKVMFEYDFGDSWEHDVVLSKVEDYADCEQPKVRLVGGKRACPPEDCGGVWGYCELCEAMKHPYSARAREQKEWLGYKYDPEEFWLEDVQEDIDRFNI